MSASPVQHGRFPEWFEIKVRAAFAPGEDFGTAWLRAKQWMNAGFWDDHTGRTIHNGQEVFVAEPYQPCQKMIDACVRLAKRINCWFEVSKEPGAWRPNTTRLVFYNWGATLK